MSGRIMEHKDTVGLRKRWLKHTLTLLIPLALVCILAVTAVFAAYHYRGLENELDYRVRICMELFLSYTQEGEGTSAHSCIELVEAFREDEDVCVQLVDPAGGILACSWGVSADSTGAEDTLKALYSVERTSYLGPDPDTGKRVLSVSVPLLDAGGGIVGALRFVAETKQVDRQILWLALTATFFCALFVMILVLISNYYMDSMLTPLADITAKAKMIAGGSYGVRIQTQYRDEIGELAETINDMSAQINQNEKTQTEFISSLSHELRTPLTAITGWGETLLDADRMDPEEARRGLQIILRETGRLTEMVEDLLDFTRIQDGRMTLNVEQADIRSEFEDTLFMYGSRLKQEGITIRYQDTDEEIPEIACDPKRMRQVFLNVFDNAAKHGGDGKLIDASICSQEDLVIIRIRDYGPGIPEDELPLVKKKFYKGSSKARGSGIGLAVCDEILQMHGGWLELSNADGGGTLVTIALPVSQ